MSARSPFVQTLLSNMHLFRDFSPEELELVMQSLILETRKENELLFEEEEPADSLFILVSGQVHVEHVRKGKVVNLGQFLAGDYFGEEALYSHQPIRRSTAITDQPCSLLRIERDALANMLSTIPALKPRLQLALRSFELRNALSFPWLGEGETIYHITRTHSVFLLRAMILPALIFLAAFLLLAGMGFGNFNIILNLLLALAGIGLVIWNSIDWSNDFCIVTDRRLVFLEKVVLLYQSRHETPLEAVLSVGLKTGVWGRLLGFGDVNVRTFTGVVHFRKIPQPALTLALIEHYWQRSKQNQADNNRSTLEDSIRLRLMPRQEQEEEEFIQPTDQQSVQSGEVPIFLERLFRLREEIPGGILYRTHWWILVRKSFPPVLGLIFLFGLIILYYGWVRNFLPDGIFLTGIALGGVSMLAWWVYAVVDWHNDVYIITGDQVLDIYKKPLAEEERQAAPLKNIQTITFKRSGPIGLLLNFGTVFIRVGDIEFKFNNVSNPSEVQRELFDRYMERTQQEKQAKVESERERMAEWIEAYHRIIKETGQNEKNNENLSEVG